MNHHEKIFSRATIQQICTFLLYGGEGCFDRTPCPYKQHKENAYEEMTAVLREKYPDEMELWRDKPWLFRSPGGETMQQVYDRVSRALQRICHEHRGQTVAIVSHGCAIRNALCFCHGKGIEGLNDIPWVRNTSISRVDQDDDGRFTVVFENDFEHVKDIVKL